MSKVMGIIEKLEISGEATLRIDVFQKREAKLTKDAAEKGFIIEIVKVYESRGHKYVNMKAKEVLK